MVTNRAALVVAYLSGSSLAVYSQGDETLRIFLRLSG